MFLLNVGYKENILADVEELKGAVYLAARHLNVRFTRKPGPELARVMLDPQLYLAGIDISTCAKACVRLASHPWFCVPGVTRFDSGLAGVKEWQRSVEEAAMRRWPGMAPEGALIEHSCRASIECQLGFGCTHVILPAPLITEREDEGGTLAQWLDTGLEAVSEMEVSQPVLATVAVSDITLNNETFSQGGFLNALVDQVSAREGVAGVYIVISQTEGTQHPFATQELALKAYLHLSRAFRIGGMSSVVVNFADVFGFVCTAVGATDIATGPSQAPRRLSLASFRDEVYGIALPHFYSHRVIGEFAPETDLNRLITARLIRRVLDSTPHSQDLLDAINNGQTAAALPQWAESRNNLTAAQKHFVCRLALEGAKFRKLSRQGREDLVRDWLEDAAAGSLYLQNRLGRSEIGRSAPAQTWLDLLDS